MLKPREPVFNIPGSVLAVLAVLIAVHVLRLSLSVEADNRLIGWLAFLPIRFTAFFDPAAVASRLAAWTASSNVEDGHRAAFAGYFLRQGSWPALPSLVTYALVHGGWTHLGLNGVWLLAFGAPVARRLGPARFLLFNAVAAIAGALTHWALFPFGAEPLVGASAAVSGCMGAALRFAFRFGPADARSAPSGSIEPLGAILRDRRALSFLIFWMLSNALFGIGSESFGLSDQPVAWQAHVGGFLVGLLLFRFFDPAVPTSAAPDPLAPESPDATLLPPEKSSP